MICDFIIDGVRLPGLLDTGSSKTLLSKRAVIGKEKKTQFTVFETINSSSVSSNSTVLIKSVVTYDGVDLGSVTAHVLESLPLGLDLVVGFDLLKRSGFQFSFEGGVSVVKFTSFQPVNKKPRLLNTEIPTNDSSLTIDDRDFSAKFNGNSWTIQWKWTDPSKKPSSTKFYNTRVRDEDKLLFDNEILEWIQEGILVKHDVRRHGSVKFFLPMIAVRQVKGENIKVRPVLDYREFNKSIESHPGGATPICSERLREWRQMGTDCSILDLKKAYLQVKVDPSLYAYQAVKWRGKVYLLTRLGFGLASAPKIMTAIVEKVLSLKQCFKNVVSSYIDDLMVNTKEISVEEVQLHLSRYGLKAKEPLHFGDVNGTRVLGLKVLSDMTWTRDGILPNSLKDQMTRREVHSILGEWVGHYPVAGWLRVASSFIQRCTAQECSGWNGSVNESIMEKLCYVNNKLSTEGDPVRGKWPVNVERPACVWADASAIALGVALVVDGDIIEDASWLRPKNDSAHINRSELDAVIRGINMSIKWGFKDVTIMTDSATVFGWIRATIEKTHNVKTAALSEILIRRRLEILKEIVAENSLCVAVRLVRSQDNVADKLTRVPSSWLTNNTAKSTEVTCVNVRSPAHEQLVEIHEKGHFGVERTFALAKERYGDAVSKKRIRKVVRGCEACARIDPAILNKWDKGTLQSALIWEKLAIDITYIKSIPYLSIIDSASRFTICRRLRNESAYEVCFNIEQVVSEFGPPNCIMSDNGTVFRSRDFKDLLKRWDIRQIFTCAYRSQGNGMVERVHRSIKRSIARSKSGVAEAVFWLNNSSTGESSSPYELLFSMKSKKPGISHSRKMMMRSELKNNLKIQGSNDSYEDIKRHPFSIGDQVYLRPADGKCDKLWSGPHRITEILSGVSVIINDDGIARHVSHLRLVNTSVDESNSSVRLVEETDSNDDTDLNIVQVYRREEQGGSGEDLRTIGSTNVDLPVLRRSSRKKVVPVKLRDYVLD